MTTSRTIAACEECSRRKRACIRRPSSDDGVIRVSDAEGQPPCERCAELGLPCLPQQTYLTRREREKLEKKRRWREAQAEKQQRNNLALRRDADAVTPRTLEKMAIPGSAPNNLELLAVPFATQLCGGSPKLPSLWLAKDFGVFRGSPAVPSHGTIPASSSSSYPLVPIAVNPPERPLAGNYNNFIFPSLAAYWDSFHISSPFVHKFTFEQAMGFTGSPIYGASQRPMALLYAMAGMGIRYAEIPTTMSEAERLECCRAFNDTAKTLLLAGYLTTEQPSISDMEAAQVLFLLYMYALCEKAPTDTYLVLKRGLTVVRKLYYVVLGGDNFANFRGTPRDANEWAFNEMVLRAYIIYGLWDSGQSYLVGREPINDVFSEPFILPGSDGVFSFPAQVAFDTLSMSLDVEQQMSPTWTVVDISPLGSLDVDPLVAKVKINQLVVPIFHGTASNLALVCVLVVLRNFRRLIRTFANSTGVDPIRLASAEHAHSPPNDNLNPESRYHRYVNTLVAMIGQISASMPPDIGMPLSQGDPRMLLQMSNFYWPDSRYAHAFLDTYIACRAMHLENWLPGMSVDPPQDFFQSTSFLSVLEAAIVITRTLAFELAFDELALRYVRVWSCIPLLRVGGLHVAAAKMIQRQTRGVGSLAQAADGFKEDARTIYRWLKGMGSLYKPLDRQLFNKFDFLMEDAGIETESRLRVLPGSTILTPSDGTPADGTLSSEHSVVDGLPKGTPFRNPS